MLPQGGQGGCHARAASDTACGEARGDGIDLGDQVGIGQPPVAAVIDHRDMVRRPFRRNPDEFVPGMHSLLRRLPKGSTDGRANPDLCRWLTVGEVDGAVVGR